ncbi:hypothetical protein J6590_092577 [Homalodisca vitripennis]|nr:hypothetical protein J6590_092577 [Homalodisca vitripennis]
MRNKFGVMILVPKRGAKKWPKKLAQAEERADDAEQYRRRNTVEIHGVPYNKGDDVLKVVKVEGTHEEKSR